MNHAELVAGRRYDMPPGFGPSVAPDVESGFAVHNSTVEFETSREAVAALMPRWFVPTERPMLSIAYRTMLGMAWMGGRDYQLVSVRVTSTYVDDTEQNVLPFTLVIWESDYAPVVAGRELMGAPKLAAEIPVADVGPAAHSFECCEYGTRLMEGRLFGLEEVPPDQVARQRAESATGHSYFWKYIPGPEGQTDADYPIRISMRTPFTHQWRGAGELTWGAPSTHEAPYSARIIDRLRELPRLSRIRASAWYAEDCVLLRNATKRLDSD